jgi:hypothetical protein
MNYQSSQLIPDADTIICLSDESIIRYLNSHDTYKAKSLLNQLYKFNYSERAALVLLEEVLEKVYQNPSHINNSPLAQKIQEFVQQNKGANFNEADQLSMQSFLSEGVKCNLLQPDGKGWQKGMLRVCFEFTLEENEPIAVKEDLVETECSSLDEIRQLVNSLPIEQN